MFLGWFWLFEWKLKSRVLETHFENFYYPGFLWTQVSKDIRNFASGRFELQLTKNLKTPCPLLPSTKCNIVIEIEHPNRKRAKKMKDRAALRSRCHLLTHKHSSHSPNPRFCSSNKIREWTDADGSRTCTTERNPIQRLPVFRRPHSLTTSRSSSKKPVGTPTPLFPNDFWW